tara:strand:- start:6290 stop:6895 length:606 start_codon:yes stop_codon:yes gene_type:complete
MKDYQDLQTLYQIADINENCIDIDFAYAFIAAMASSELDLSQWMPMLFVNADESLSSEKVANNFAQAVLAIYENCRDRLQQQLPLYIPDEKSLVEGENVLPYDEAIHHQKISQFAKGYLQALMLIDNVQALRFPEGSVEGNLQQTCLLLLDKLANPQTTDPQKLALFEQLPSSDEIIALLPILLSRYGAQCLNFSGKGEGE